jgi:exosortase A-associated hydrolase 2
VTSDSAGVHAQPFFIQGTAGYLFAIYYPAQSEVSKRRDVIFLPPFAEEMNKSRRMLALQARNLAKAGIGVLVLDLFGTGESQGDFAEARWSIWKSDVAIAREWLQRRGPTLISALGLRLGGLLAMDLAKQENFFERLVLWQPVINGESMLNQFLRLRIAADMMSGAEERESTRSLRRIITSGVSIEVGGYELTPELVTAIDGLRIEELSSRDSPPVSWLELTSEEGRSLAPASQRVIERWRENGIHVDAKQVTGPPFWSAAEIAEAPELLQTTTRIFQEAAIR